MCHLEFVYRQQNEGGKGDWNNNLLLYSKFDSMLSPAESLLSMLQCRRPCFFSYVFCTSDSQLDLVLTTLFERVIPGIGSKNFGPGPSMQIRVKVLNIFSNNEDLSSVLIRFSRENVCSTLAFDTGSENNNSTSNKTRCHKPLQFDWNILCQATHYLGFSWR